MNKPTISTRFLQMMQIRDDDEEEEGQEFDPDTAQQLEVEHYEREPYYLAADDTDGYKNNFGMAVNMDTKARPTLNGLVDTCRAERESPVVLFEQGMWVEYRSNNMEWKVGLVNRVVKQTPDDWDFEVDGDIPDEKLNVFYNVGLEGLLDKDSIRAPIKGLQFLFGKRPWLWQQFTLLQLEKRIRFDPSHEYDFDEIDCHEFASDRFDLWLEAPENADFKAHFEQQPEMAKFLLKDHLLTPFDLMDQVVENEEEWDFDDPDISVYTYLGVLGSGIIISMITLAIQIFSPLIVMYNAMIVSDGGPNFRFDVDGTNEDDPIPLGGHFLPTTDWDTFCLDNQNPREEGKALIAIVLLVYMATVIPDSLLSFFRTSGGAASTYSKINSLRQIIWNQNDDDLTQQLGFKLDRLMNTGYVTILYLMMLFILLQTPVILDIILNALAIEFIHEIDERIANSDWWDENNRWIRAGTIELVMQATLRLRLMERPKEFCATFDIDHKDYTAALGGNHCLRSARVAHKDDNDPRYMTTREREFSIVAEEAAQRRERFILDQYRKRIRQFGFTSIFWTFVGIRKSGLFHRYSEYRVWSRWEKIMFLPRIPNLDERSSKRLGVKKSVNVPIGKNDLQEFIEHIALVLTGVEMSTSIYQAAKHGYLIQIPQKFILGILEIVFYWLEILFPILVSIGLIVVPYCY